MAEKISESERATKINATMQSDYCAVAPGLAKMLMSHNRVDSKTALEMLKTVADGGFSHGNSVLTRSRASAASQQRRPMSPGEEFIVGASVAAYLLGKPAPQWPQGSPEALSQTYRLLFRPAGFLAESIRRHMRRARKRRET